MIASTSLGSTGRPLRLLIVDDNHINLSILSTLLKRRFSHLIEGNPITVDSGLKAIQLLRTHVFDCIFMDIQMPFLSGLDATRRIRNAEDGILTANSDAHIVAVTTAVGSEPEMAYRRARMDGMIGKPVRFKHLQKYLLPLAQQADISAQSVDPIFIDGLYVMPPLPPASQHQRVFYLPLDATTPASRPDICKGEDFEDLLNKQTRASLRHCGAIAVERSNSTNKERYHQAHVKDDIFTHFKTGPSHTYSSLNSYHLLSASSGFNNNEDLTSSTFSIYSKVYAQKQKEETTRDSGSEHLRKVSMTINQKTFSKQIAREMANADLQGDSSDDIVQSIHFMSPRSIRKVQSRPQIVHRTSSPGWLLSEEVTRSTLTSPHMASTAIRPKLATICSANATQSSSSSSYTSTDGSGSEYPSPLRRESQASSSSFDSGISSTVTTPSLDEATFIYWESQYEQREDKCADKDHRRFSSNSTVDPFDNTLVDEIKGDIPTSCHDAQSTDSEARMASTSSLRSLPCKNPLCSQLISLGKASLPITGPLDQVKQIQSFTMNDNNDEALYGQVQKLEII